MALISNETSNSNLSGNNSESNSTSQYQGPSNSMPNANNMLISGRTSGNISNAGSIGSSGIGGARSTSTKKSASGGASLSSSSVSTSLQQLPRPSSTPRGNVAAFLTKLYNMVTDEGSNNLIKWSDDGQSFIVVNHVEFAKEVLPKFFKHNNFSSFVRQLNMYGFHKVPHLQQGVLLPDADSEQWEFSNPHFQKNQPDLLCLVSRKKASNGNEDKDALTMDLGHILKEVTAIKKHQIAISADLKNIERDHQSLWQESIAARERHQRQQDTIDKVLRFLASVFSGEKKRAIVPNKKPRLTITEGDVDDGYDHESSHGSDGEHEEEVTKLLGSKRKRASMVESEADYVLPGMEPRDSPSTKPVFNISEMTPAALALLATASQSAQSMPTSSPFVPPTSISSTSAASTTKPLLPSISVASSQAHPTVLSSSASTTSSPNYLNAFPALNFNAPVTTSQQQQHPFKLDGANLSIPTTLLPNAISPAHQDMLRSLSMANAQGVNPVPPLPSSFVHTPAGANVVKGVDQIAKEMEQLQRSLEALEAHGLNMTDFTLDGNYLNPNAFDPNAFGDLTTISESGIPYQDPLGGEGDTMVDMINTDQDDLSLITPAFDHQHISSGQITPLSGSTVTDASLSLATTPVEMNNSNATTPTTPRSVPLPVSPAVSSTGSILTTATTPALVPSTLVSTRRESRASTVGEEYLEDLLDLDAA
ncbi:stress-responsive transcription factor hsf1 [Mortierella polycephala]|uniref:Stress-responsive transcription factor hsf1 n=1 Tax=Mortierella polycephala TaxID=41804 RepID=A0A9P6Q984_9FUNG|nr:stress-responsive transcription factor hsf1 [Mortierella polycephala]